MEKTKVVIIGGGVIGTSIAYHLAKKGCNDVILLEKDEVASGPSGRAAGEVTNFHLNETDMRMRAESFETIMNFAKDEEFCFHDIGFLRFFTEKEMESAYKKTIQLQKKIGIEGVKLITPKQCKDIVPDMNMDDVVGAVFRKEDGWIDPYLLTMAFSKRARAMGVDIRTKMKVKNIFVKYNRVRGVETENSIIKSEFVVNAGGGWSPQISRMAGVEIPVAPYRRQLLVIKPKEKIGYTVPNIIKYAASEEQGLFLRDDGHNRLAVVMHKGTGVGERKVNPDRFNRNYDLELVDQVGKELEYRFPRFADAEIVDGWACMYAITPDSKYIIDRVREVEGFIVCTGFCGCGIEVSPAAGKLVAELILEGKPKTIPDIREYSLERFA